MVHVAYGLIVLLDIMTWKDSEKNSLLLDTNDIEFHLVYEEGILNVI